MPVPFQISGPVFVDYLKIWNEHSCLPPAVDSSVKHNRYFWALGVRFGVLSEYQGVQKSICQTQEGEDKHGIKDGIQIEIFGMAVVVHIDRADAGKDNHKEPINLQTPHG